VASFNFKCDCCKEVIINDTVVDWKICHRSPESWSNRGIRDDAECFRLCKECNRWATNAALSMLGIEGMEALVGLIREGQLALTAKAVSNFKAVNDAIWAARHAGTAPEWQREVLLREEECDTPVVIGPRS
jgi:hypothetical protein